MDQRWGMLNRNFSVSSAAACPVVVLRQVRKGALPVEGQVAVHHAGHAHGGRPPELHAVFLPHVGGQVGVGVPQAVPHSVQGVGPQAVLILILPGMPAGGDGSVVGADKHRLDAGGAQLDA